jgi:hypothetical protein
VAMSLNEDFLFMRFLPTQSSLSTPPLCSSSSFIEMLKVNLIIVFFFGFKLSYVCIFNFLHLLFFVHFLIVFKSLNFLYLNP